VTIDIDCSYTPRDFVRSQYLHIKRRLWLYAVCTGIVLLLAAAIYLTPSAAHELQLETSVADFLESFPWLVGWIVYLVAYYGVYIQWRARRVFAQTKELHVPVRFSLGDSGLTMENANGRSTMPWDHILKWRESRDLFLLYPNDILFYMIPKRCIADEATATALSALLGSHVKRMG
jgi:hypothetical protein